MEDATLITGLLAKRVELCNLNAGLRERMAVITNDIEAVERVLDSLGDQGEAVTTPRAARIVLFFYRNELREYLPSRQLFPSRPRLEEAEYQGFRSSGIGAKSVQLAAIASGPRQRQLYAPAIACGMTKNTTSDVELIVREEAAAIDAEGFKLAAKHKAEIEAAAREQTEEEEAAIRELKRQNPLP